MRTSKAFEMISYNTQPFLELKIKELIKAKIISFAFWINHKPDTDEKREHNHVYIIPSKLIQTDDIQDEFIEPDPDQPNKPLKGRIERTSNYDFKTAKWDDALLYAIHDKQYLKNKGLTRNIYYKWEDLKSTDEDRLQALINRITPWADKPVEKLKNSIKNGETRYKALLDAGIPMQQIGAALQWISVIQEENKNFLPERNGKHSHTERAVCCKICGEIKSIREFPFTSIETDLNGNDFGECFACLWREKNK